MCYVIDDPLWGDEMYEDCECCPYFYDCREEPYDED